MILFDKVIANPIWDLGYKVKDMRDCNKIGYYTITCKYSKSEPLIDGLLINGGQVREDRYEGIMIIEKIFY